MNISLEQFAKSRIKDKCFVLVHYEYSEFSFLLLQITFVKIKPHLFLALLKLNHICTVRCHSVLFPFNLILNREKLAFNLILNREKLECQTDFYRSQFYFLVKNQKKKVMKLVSQSLNS